MKFLSKLRITRSDCDNVILDKPFIIQLFSGYKFRVPRGFMTDYATIPRVLQGFYRKIGEGYYKSAVLHDFLYRYYCGQISRRLADDIFLEAMGQEMKEVLYKKYNHFIIKQIMKLRFFIRKNIIYYAVRLGGWMIWNKYKKMLKI